MHSDFLPSFDDLPQFEEEEQAERAEQEGAGDLHGEPEGSVASEGRTEAAMLVFDLFVDLRGRI
jgi:hypothetical protein